MNFVIYREVLTVVYLRRLPYVIFPEIYLRQSNSFHRHFAQWNCGSHCYVYNNATSRTYSKRAHR